MSEVFWTGAAAGLLVGFAVGAYVEWRIWYERGKVPDWNGMWKV